ncbi:hypothetical protein M3Y97_00937800 [Aphelenchoides bicaudatus]|nr:hypothetical protein M3Y97_00937800 [Aphelenchoides bicaudatus]
MWSYKQNHAQPSVIQFYASKSNISKNYVKIYTEAARLPEGWPEFMKFYAVDCSNRTFFDVCKQQRFRRIPLIKYYSAGHSSKDSGKIIKTYTNSTNLRAAVFKELNKDYVDGKCQYCRQLAYFDEKLSTLEDAWNFVKSKCDTRDILLVPVKSLDDLNGLGRTIKVDQEVWNLFNTFRNASAYLYGDRVYRITKTHPLIRALKMEENELLMLTREGDNWPKSNETKIFNSRFIGEFPYGPSQRDFELPECSKNVNQLGKLNLKSLVNQLKDSGAHKIQSEMIGSFYVQYYFKS